jgi:hypothetical protein
VRSALMRLTAPDPRAIGACSASPGELVVSTVRRRSILSVVVCMIRVVVLSVVTVLWAVAAAVVLSAPAHACSCVGFTDARNLRLADAVFTGTLIDRQEPPWRPVMSSGDPATLTFEVRWVHKGEAQRLQQVETAMSGASCGLEIEGSGPFLVFADHAQNGSTLTASLCGGTRAIADGGPSTFEENYPPEPGGTIPGNSSADRVLATVVVSAVAAVLTLIGWFRR